MIPQGRVSLRTRFLLVLLLVAVLPLGLVGGWLVLSSSRAGETLLRTQLQDLAAVEADRLTTRWQELNGDLLLLSDNDVAWRVLVGDDGAGGGAPPWLVDAFRSANRAIVRVHYEDATRRTRLSLPAARVQAASPAGVQAASPAGVQAASPAGVQAASPAAASQRTAIPAAFADTAGLFHVRLPVVDGDGGVVGAMHAELNLGSVLDALQHVGRPDALFAVVDTRTGAVLAAPPLPAEALSDGRFDWADQEWLSVGHALDEPPLELRVAAPLTPVIRPFARAARTGGIMLLLISGLVVVVATWITGRITRSLADATRAAEAIAGGDLEHRVEVRGTDEVGRLGRSLNSLAASLRATLDALALQRTQAALGEFATAIAHEVRNAHTTIGVDLERVLEESADRPSAQAALRRSLRRVRNVDRIVDGALRIARSGRVEYRVVDLARVLEDATRAVQPWFGEQDATFESRPPAEDSLEIMGDAAALETLFVNLLRNAAQAVAPGGRIELAWERSGGEAIVVIRDDGRGMSGDELTAAFQPFVTSRPDGTGLGLPIARQIAYAHGGDIEIDSAPGCGTRVQVRLAARASGAETVRAPDTPVAPPRAAASQQAILMTSIRFLTTILLLAAAAPVAAQQAAVQQFGAGADSVPERPARWSLALRDSAGLAVLLHADVDPGWYLYALAQPEGGPQPLQIALAESGGFRLAGDILSPRPRTYPDRTFNLYTAIHRGSVTFTLPVAAGNQAAPADSIAALVTYQMCNDRYCLPPRTDTVRASLQTSRGSSLVSPLSGPAGGIPLATASRASAVALDGANPEPASHEGQEDGDVAMPTPPDPAALAAPALDDDSAMHVAPLQAAAATWAVFGQRSVFAPGEGGGSAVAFVWLAFAMGLVSLLTPCVFPMVPLTVAYFGSRSEAPRGVRVRNATLFGAGIVLTFALAGLLISLVFGAASMVRLAANPWMNLAIAALFLAFALNLLGVFEIRLPTRIVDAAARRGSGTGGTGAALMGTAFAITSFTCTAPFIGTLLVLATRGSWQWPLLGLVVYAAAFALPFVLLAAGPAAVHRLPRAGVWLPDLRRVLGVVELAAAVKFLSNADLVWGLGLLSRNAVILAWALASFGVVGLMLYRRPLRAPRMAAAALALLASVWLARGTQGHRLGELEAFLPPPQHGVLLALPGELPWQLNDYEGSLALARMSQRPLFVDFTGYTCTNCRWMEANMFPREDVRTLLGEYVRVRLFTDGQGAVYQQQQILQQQMFGTVALPYYAVVRPDGSPLATFLGMTRDPSEFSRFLQVGLAATNILD